MDRTHQIPMLVSISIHSLHQDGSVAKTRNRRGVAQQSRQCDAERHVPELAVRVVPILLSGSTVDARPFGTAHFFRTRHGRVCARFFGGGCGKPSTRRSRPRGSHLCYWRHSSPHLAPAQREPSYPSPSPQHSGDAGYMSSSVTSERSILSAR